MSRAGPTMRTHRGWWRKRAASQLTAVRLAAGQARTAARWSREVISVARSGQHRSFVSVEMSNVAMVVAMSGDPDAAQRMLASSAQEISEGPAARRPRRSWEARASAWTLAAQGSLSAAAEMLVAAATPAAERGQWPTAATLWHVAVRLGATQHAVEGLDTAELAGLVRGPDARPRGGQHGRSVEPAGARDRSHGNTEETEPGHRRFPGGVPPDCGQPPASPLRQARYHRAAGTGRCAAFDLRRGTGLCRRITP